MTYTPLRERFEEKFMKTYPDGSSRALRGIDIEDIFDFLQSEIEQARKEEREKAQGLEKLIEEICEMYNRYGIPTLCCRFYDLVKNK